MENSKIITNKRLNEIKLMKEICCLKADLNTESLDSSWVVMREDDPRYEEVKTKTNGKSREVVEPEGFFISEDDNFEETDREFTAYEYGGPIYT